MMSGWLTQPQKPTSENSYDTLNQLWIVKLDLGYEYMTSKPFARSMRRHHMNLRPGSFRWHLVHTMEMDHLSNRIWSTMTLHQSYQWWWDRAKAQTLSSIAYSFNQWVFMLLSMEHNTLVLDEANLSMQFALVTKIDNTRRKILEQPVWKLYQTPYTWMCQLSSVGLWVQQVWSHWALEVKVQRSCPSPQTEWEKSTPQKDKKHYRKKGHTDIIKMEEFNGQYDEINVHFVRPYLDMVSDADKIMIDDIKRPGKQKHIPLCTFQLILMPRPMPPSQ